MPDPADRSPVNDDIPPDAHADPTAIAPASEKLTTGNLTTDEPPTDEPSTDEPAATKQRGWLVPQYRRPAWKPFARGLLVRVVVYYLMLVVAVACFQRTLIYRPTKTASLPARQSGLGSDRVSDLSLSTSDGLTLHGWHIRPAPKTVNSVADPLPGSLPEPTPMQDSIGGDYLVLFFPPNMGNRQEHVYDARPWSAIGADVWHFDYRGFGDNSGSANETAITADAQRIWKAARDTGVGPERIILYGESLGGAVAIRLAAELCRTGTPPAGVVVAGTFLSLADVARWHYPWLPVRWLLIDRFSSCDRISSLTCPYLQVHGTADDIVPLNSGKQLFDQAPAQSHTGIAKRWVAVPNAGHNDFAEQSLRVYFTDFLRDLERSPKPDASEDLRPDLESP